ncbi:MAG: cupin domain-containing protein [Povalibacter sp.]
MSFLISAGAVLASSIAIAEEPSAAPTPGSPGIYVDHTIVAAKLAEAIASSKDPAAAPMATTDQYLLSKVHRSKIAPPAIHPGWTELHLVLEGSATFVTGGKITTSAQGTPTGIEGGVSHKISKGDAVIVPANTPHWYKQIDGQITAIELRFLSPEPKALDTETR